MFVENALHIFMPHEQQISFGKIFFGCLKAITKKKKYTVKIS